MTKTAPGNDRLPATHDRLRSTVAEFASGDEGKWVLKVRRHGDEADARRVRDSYRILAGLLRKAVRQGLLRHSRSNVISLPRPNPSTQPARPRFPIMAASS
jgi:hypothetical protein